MNATDHQLNLIKTLANKYFGDDWRDNVDALCITNSTWKDWDYKGVERMSNTEAGWLISELEIRVKSLRQPCAALGSKSTRRVRGGASFEDER